MIENPSYFEQEEPVLRCAHGFIVDHPAECPSHPDFIGSRSYPTEEEAEAVSQAIGRHNDQDEEA